MIKKIKDFLFRRKHSFNFSRPRTIHSGVYTEVNKSDIQKDKEDPVEITFDVYTCRRCGRSYILDRYQVENLPQHLKYCKE